MASILQLFGAVGLFVGLCLFGLPGAVVAVGLVSLLAGLGLEVRKRGDA